MVHKRQEISPIRTSRLILGFCLCAIFLIAYIACGMPYVSGNPDPVNTVFTGKSLYTPGENLENKYHQGLSNSGRTISVLSAAEDRFLYGIGSQISDSIESASLEINQKTMEQLEAEKTDDNSTQESSSPPAEETSSPAALSIEASFINMINHIRSSRGLQTLLPNAALNNIARSRSQDMLSRGYFSHQTPEGKGISAILQENGIMYACCAENLGQASPPSWGSPETIMNMWMGSSIHRANLLNPHFGQMGIGIVDSGGRRVVTLVLINR
jgi:uncharacterized protein YkwD